jgi:hypothetical protein
MSSIKDILPKTEKDIIKFDPNRLREKLKSVAFSGSAEEHWKKNYKEFSEELKSKQSEIRRGKYYDTQADHDARKFKENARKAGNEFTKSDEKDIKLILHSLTRGKMKELREKYIKEKKLDIKEKKPVNAYLRARDFSYEDEMKQGRKYKILSFLSKKKDAGLKTVAGLSRGSTFSISADMNKRKPAGFAGSDKINSDPSGFKKYGSEAVAGIGQVPKPSNAGKLHNLPNKPDDYHPPIKLAA